MKMTKKLIPATIWIAFIASLTISCDDGAEAPAPIDETLDVRSSFVSNSNAALSQLRNLGFSGPMGAFYGRTFGNNGRTAETPSSMMHARVSDDSTDVNYCYTETFQDDGNGNYRYVIDFGDGCDFYGSYMYGKMEEIGSYTDSSYSSSVTYTQFGGSHDEGDAEWWIDGTSTYAGTWSESFEDTPEDSTAYDSSDYWDSYYYYESAYEYTADMTQTYIEFVGAPEDSVSTGEEVYIVDYVAEGSEEMDDEGYTVLSRTTSVSANTGESYTSQVDVPLFMDYGCYEEDVWVFVSGVESGTYTYEGATGDWSIEYGDGSCDNIVIVTENGESEEVDLGEEWDDWEDECDDEHGDED